MEVLLRRLIAGLGFFRRRVAGVFRFDRLGSFNAMNDAQLRDIGLWRVDEQIYLRLREPAALEMLFPDSGGTYVCTDCNSRSGPMKPRPGIKNDMPAG